MTWYSWIYQGSGNANFYYGMTLGLGFAQVWLLVEILHYALETRYRRKHSLFPFIKSSQVGENQNSVDDNNNNNNRNVKEKIN